MNTETNSEFVDSIEGELDAMGIKVVREPDEIIPCENVKISRVTTGLLRRIKMKCLRCVKRINEFPQLLIMVNSQRMRIVTDVVRQCNCVVLVIIQELKCICNPNIEMQDPSKG